MTCTTVAPGAAWSAAAHGYHVKMAVTRPDLSAPQRGRIKPIHPAVDGRLGLRHRQPTQPAAPAAIAASTVPQASGSWTRRVRATIADTRRYEITPVPNTAASRGSQSRKARATIN